MRMGRRRSTSLVLFAAKDAYMFCRELRKNLDFVQIEGETKDTMWQESLLT